MSLPKMSHDEFLKVQYSLETDPVFQKPMRWGKGRVDTPSVPDVADPVMLDLSSIKVPKNCRPIVERAMAGLIDSIGAIGMNHPIAVLRISQKEYELVSGLHRLEAHKRLNLTHIRAIMLDANTAKLWRSSENIHRADLSPLQVSEEIVQYEQNRSLGVGPLSQPELGGRQPADCGNSRLAKELHVNRKRVRKARKHAAICEGARQILHSNQSCQTVELLDKIAGCETPEQQIERAKAAAEKQLNPKPKPNPIVADRDHKTLGRLLEKWRESDLRKDYCNAAWAVRAKFIAELRKQ